MLALAMTVFTLRQVSSDEIWQRAEKYVKYAFWGTNIGLLMMTLLSLFPIGVLQVWDVMENGYANARSHTFTRTNQILFLEWMRFPGDMLFICLGSVPMAIACIKIWLGLRTSGANQAR